jgi:hypothetical protein
MAFVVPPSVPSSVTSHPQETLVLADDSAASKQHQQERRGLGVFPMGVPSGVETARDLPQGRSATAAASTNAQLELHHQATHKEEGKLSGPSNRMSSSAGSTAAVAGVRSRISSVYMDDPLTMEAFQRRQRRDDGASLLRVRWYGGGRRPSDATAVAAAASRSFEKQQQQHPQEPGARQGDEIHLFPDADSALKHLRPPSLYIERKVCAR